MVRYDWLNKQIKSAMQSFDVFFNNHCPSLKFVFSFFFFFIQHGQVTGTTQSKNAIANTNEKDVHLPKLFFLAFASDTSFACALHGREYLKNCITAQHHYIVVPDLFSSI